MNRFFGRHILFKSEDEDDIDANMEKEEQLGAFCKERLDKVTERTLRYKIKLKNIFVLFYIFHLNRLNKFLLMLNY